MSKSVRLKDYLADELEKIAARENRSLANLVNTLLEQAIEMDNRPVTKQINVAPGVSAQISTTPAAERARTDADAQPRDIPSRTVKPSGGLSGVGEGGSKRPQAEPPPEDHFRPDPKPEKKRK